MRDSLQPHLHVRIDPFLVLSLFFYTKLRGIGWAYVCFSFLPSALTSSICIESQTFGVLAASIDFIGLDIC